MPLLKKPGHLVIREAPIPERAFHPFPGITHVTLAGAARYQGRDLQMVARQTGVSVVEIHGLQCSLVPLLELPTLTTLSLFDPRSLEGLEEFRGIESLTLYDIPKIRSIAPLAALASLKRLVVSTPPGYDSSRKVHTVESFAPVGYLQHLEDLVLRGVWPQDGRLAPLHQLTALRRVAIDHVFGFTMGDYVALARALPDVEGHCLQPTFEAAWAGACPRGCGNARVVLTAPPPRTSSLMCPV